MLGRRIEGRMFVESVHESVAKSEPMRVIINDRVQRPSKGRNSYNTRAKKGTPEVVPSPLGCTAQQHRR